MFLKLYSQRGANFKKTPLLGILVDRRLFNYILSTNWNTPGQNWSQADIDEAVAFWKAVAQHYRVKCTPSFIQWSGGY